MLPWCRLEDRHLRQLYSSSFQVWFLVLPIHLPGEETNFSMFICYLKIISGALIKSLGLKDFIWFFLKILFKCMKNCVNFFHLPQQWGLLRVLFKWYSTGKLLYSNFITVQTNGTFLLPFFHTLTLLRMGLFMAAQG